MSRSFDEGVEIRNNSAKKCSFIGDSLFMVVSIAVDTILLPCVFLTSCVAAITGTEDEALSQVADHLEDIWSPKFISSAPNGCCIIPVLRVVEAVVLTIFDFVIATPCLISKGLRVSLSTSKDL